MHSSHSKTTSEFKNDMKNDTSWSTDMLLPNLRLCVAFKSQITLAVNNNTGVYKTYKETVENAV
jgi:hypothetical protein